MGSFDEKEVRETVKAPDNFAVLLLLAVGYAKKLDVADKFLHLARPRKSLREVASEEEFGKYLTIN